MSTSDLKQRVEAHEARQRHLDDALKETWRLIESRTHFPRRLESVLGPDRLVPSRLVDEMRKREDAVRTAIGSLGDYQHHGILYMDTSWQREAERMAQSIASYEKQFRLPELNELSRLTRQLAERDVVPAIGAYQEHTAALRRAMEAIHTPWLDMQDELRSLTGFAELQTIGQGLRNLAPFGDELTALLRQGLGDWRSVVQLPQGIEDAGTRLDFYHSLGFNSALTNFPAPAFEQSLHIAGLRLPSLPPVLRKYERAGEAEPDDGEEADFARNRHSYDVLLRFENQVRQFIVATMEAAFGPQWIKQRVPGDVYRGWKKRQQTARNNGEPERPLIDYADFTDYIRIIERSDNWRDIFQPIFDRREDVQESFRRLHPIRLCTMHARIITHDDKLLLEVETRRILRAISIN